MFKDFITEEECYWLGFLYADGMITDGKRSRHNIRLTTAVKDLQHLNRFANFCKTKVRTIIGQGFGKGKEYYSVDIHNKNIWEKLINIGLLPRKTHAEKHLPRISLPMIHHFIRGYFDGDGCIALSFRKNREAPALVFQITDGHPSLLEDIAKIFRLFGGSFNIRKRSSANAYNLETSGNRICKKIYDYLYKDATIYLERKKEIFENV